MPSCEVLVKRRFERKRQTDTLEKEGKCSTWGSLGSSKQRARQLGQEREKEW